MRDLKNIEKMGRVDFDNDDDFLEEAELPKFDPKKGKNVDSKTKNLLIKKIKKLWKMLKIHKKQLKKKLIT